MRAGLSSATTLSPWDEGGMRKRENRALSEAAGKIAAPFSLLLACLASLLPERLRRHISPGDDSLVLPTAISAYLQAAGGVVLGFLMFARYHRAITSGDFTLPTDGSYAPTFVFGMTLYVGFAFSGWGVVSLWLFTEGLVRAAAAMIGSELGSAPVVIADAAVAALRRRWATHQRGPLLHDVVTFAGADFDLCIVSQISRDWDPLATIRLEGKLYRLTNREELAAATRPHVYKLHLIPPEHIVRRIEDYPLEGA
ncbi:MAG: hypothetical protein EXR72_02810 [Myxococcales bacterium]|nr:hypothetical protein [Myxococcales bacterium]